MRRGLILETIEEPPPFIKDIQKTLYEVRLFNLKLTYVNRLFSLGFNQERKQEIVRQFDLAQGIEEVKLLYYNERINGRDR